MRFALCICLLAAVAPSAPASAVNAASEGTVAGLPKVSVGRSLVATGKIVNQGEAARGSVIATAWPAPSQDSDSNEESSFEEFVLAGVGVGEDGTYELRTDPNGIPAKYRDSKGLVRIHIYAISEGSRMASWSRSIALQEGSGEDRRKSRNNYGGESRSAHIDFDLQLNRVVDHEMTRTLDDAGEPSVEEKGYAVPLLDPFHMSRLSTRWAEQREGIRPRRETLHCFYWTGKKIHNVSGWAANSWGWKQGTAKVDIVEGHDFSYGAAMDVGDGASLSGENKVSSKMGLVRERVMNRQFRNLVRYKEWRGAFDEKCRNRVKGIEVDAIQSVGNDQKEIGNHGFKNCYRYAAGDRPYKIRGREAKFNRGLKLTYEGVSLDLTAGTQWSSTYRQDFTINKASWLCGNDSNIMEEASQVGAHAR